MIFELPRKVSSDMVLDAAKRSSASSVMGKVMDCMDEILRPAAIYPKREWYHRILGEKWFVKNVETPFNHRLEANRELHDLQKENFVLSYITGYINGYLESDKIDGRGVHSITRCGECGTVVHDSKNFVKVWIDPLVLKMLVETETRVACPKCDAPTQPTVPDQRIDELLEEIIKKEEELR